MSFWTDERVTTAERLASEGLSAGQIAKQLGCTRNTVIGKLRRLSLALKGVQVQPRRTVSHAPMPVFKPASIPETPRNPCSLHERGRGCAFPISGAGADTLFCAGYTGGKPYCPTHQAVMYEPPKPPSVQRRAMESNLWAARR